MISEHNQHGESLREGGDYPNLDPRLRPTSPESPMMLDGACINGDPTLMMRCMIEELLQVGLPVEEIHRMSHDSNYQALHAARCSMGDEAINSLLLETAARIGRHHHRTIEHQDRTQEVTLTINAAAR